MKKETKFVIIAGLCMVFIDILNLAEQFGIYFIAKESSLDESTQQRFFFILFAIGGVTLFRPMFLWNKLEIIFSILIETGEFIAYLLVLPRSTNLIVVATIFFTLEVILHLTYLVTVKSDRAEAMDDCVRDYCCGPIRILFYGFLYSSPILFLFLDRTSKFRDTYYEILLILNVFFGVSYIDITLEPFCTSGSSNKSDKSYDAIIYRIWQILTIIAYNILATIILITTMIFAGQAIRRHATGEETLVQYDFGVYIYCLVNYGLLACGQVMNGCNGCIKALSRNPHDR